MHENQDAHKPLSELPQWFLVEIKEDGQRSWPCIELASGLKAHLAATTREPLEEIIATQLPRFRVARFDRVCLWDFLVLSEPHGIQVVLVASEFSRFTTLGVDPAGNRPMLGIPVKRLVAELAVAAHFKGAYDESVPVLVPLDAYAVRTHSLAENASEPAQAEQVEPGSVLTVGPEGVQE